MASSFLHPGNNRQHRRLCSPDAVRTAGEDFQVFVLTRIASSKTTKDLAKLPKVQLVEKMDIHRLGLATWEQCRKALYSIAQWSHALYRRVSQYQFSRDFRETGKQSLWRRMLDSDNPAAVVGAFEAGVIAAHSLTFAYVEPQTSKKYVVVGSQDASSKDLIEVLETYARTKIENLTCRHMTFLEELKEMGL